MGLSNYEKTQRRLKKAAEYKESYSDYKNRFRSSKRYYDKKGIMNHAEMMTEAEWKSARDLEHLSNKDLVYTDFHAYDRETVKNINASFKEQGLKLTAENRGKISRGEYTPEMYDMIKEAYHNKLKEKPGDPAENKTDAVAASEWIAGNFFGS